MNINTPFLYYKSYWTLQNQLKIKLENREVQQCFRVGTHEYRHIYLWRCMQTTHTCHPIDTLFIFIYLCVCASCTLTIQTWHVHTPALGVGDLGFHLILTWSDGQASAVHIIVTYRYSTHGQVVIYHLFGGHKQHSHHSALFATLEYSCCCSLSPHAAFRYYWSEKTTLIYIYYYFLDN